MLDGRLVVFLQNVSLKPSQAAASLTGILQHHSVAREQIKLPLLCHCLLFNAGILNILGNNQRPIISQNQLSCQQAWRNAFYGGWQVSDFQDLVLECSAMKIFVLMWWCLGMDSFLLLQRGASNLNPFTLISHHLALRKELSAEGAEAAESVHAGMLICTGVRC